MGFYVVPKPNGRAVHTQVDIIARVNGPNSCGRLDSLLSEQERTCYLGMYTPIMLNVSLRQGKSWTDPSVGVYHPGCTQEFADKRGLTNHKRLHTWSDEDA
jgi:hypothetical protein